MRSITSHTAVCRQTTGCIRYPLTRAVMQSLLQRNALVVFFSVAAACSPAEAVPREQSEPDAGPRDLVVTAFNFAYQSPDTIPAGLTRLRMKNNGPDLHHVTVVKLADGHTVQDLLARIKAKEYAPSWATYVGGPEPGPVGEETSAIVDLAPGDYAILCFISGKDHIQHLAKGMVRALTVVPSTGAHKDAPEVRADARMVLGDYTFEITPTITPGRRTIRVENHAKQPHHADLVRIVDGKTMADVNAWMGNQEGPAPFVPMGGITPIAPGQVNYFTADFVPGNYILVCFFPDANDGKPHIRHGMVREFKVE